MFVPQNNGRPIDIQRADWRSTPTLQFDDYSKYVALRFDPKAKAERRKAPLHLP